ncbi:MAG: CocE/NonD family hydrolase [Anaerolineae bacterium]|nr:CocE/NonD family hydrolase [Anaerolineae bacterium]
MMKIGCKKLVLLAVILVLALLACGVAALILATHSPAQRQSLYLEMRDGVKIAIDLWLPANMKSGQKLPTILRSTRYWRSYQPGPMAPIFGILGPILGQDVDAEGKDWTRAGYALVTVDVRGSGASFGQRPIEYSDDEIANLGEVVDWIVAQPWSNGRVGAYGVSYDGNTAELLTTLDHPAVKAVAPQYDDFDTQFHLLMPGGVFNQGFMQEWGQFTRGLDANDVCTLETAAQTECEQLQAVMAGVRRVDDDADSAQLAAALAERDNADVFQVMQAIEYRDDHWGATGKTITDISPCGQRTAIESSGVPMYVWVSWLDNASVEGALARYQTFSNPQKLIIGPWSHSGNYHADPFLPPDTKTDPSPKEQFQMLVAFFDAFLKDGGTAEPEWDITYYTLGEGEWKTTDTWPPAGFTSQSWTFGPDGSLILNAPNTTSGSDEYTVDWTASTGDATRWHTGLYKTDVVYPDRAEEDAKLLTYTSAPLETDVEITGSPIVTLYVASTESDGAFHVYLEDVAPDGRVTYITEGIMRAVHHQVSEEEPLYEGSGPYRSFERADAAPLVPGEVAEIRFDLYATSVLIKKGHYIRIALAGHDGSMFARYPADGTPVLTVQRNSVYPSHVELPVMIRE